MIPFKNTYSKLPSQFYQRVMPAKYPAPKLIAYNEELANELGISISENHAEIFSGQVIPEGAEPLAMAYAGFQFGHPVPELGDGRALLLGEVNGFDLHFKGSGRTPFSRRGDGKSALGPVIREYIVSEAMNALGIPTTRALAAVATGEEVLRQFGQEPGGVFTRVASSHIRVGTFQYFAFKQDLKSLEILLDYTISRHYPHLLKLETTKEKALGLLREVSDRQGDLIAQWSGVGFIHGVMNTDNCHVGGITIDYGPCAFMDEFKFNKVFSSIDERGRYSFFNQVPVIQWNIMRLADCFVPFFGEELPEDIYQILNSFPERRMKAFAKKMGITDYEAQDEKLVMEYLAYLEKNELDFTDSFRALARKHGEKDSSEHPIFTQWRERVKSVDQLDQINPLYIPRNHLVQKAIETVYQGDLSFFKMLHVVLKDPFKYHPDYGDFFKAPQKSERITRTFCGT